MSSWMWFPTLAVDQARAYLIAVALMTPQARIALDTWSSIQSADFIPGMS